MGKICEMKGVREFSDGYPVELWRHERTGRLVIRAYSECGNAIVDVDLWDLIDWCHSGPMERREESADGRQNTNCAGYGSD
jgi:hypothetical protein